MGVPELIASLVPSRQVTLYENRGRVHNALLRTGRRFGLLAVSEVLVGRLLDPRGSPLENRRWEYLESARQKLYEVTMWGSAREHVPVLVREPTVRLVSDSFHHRLKVLTYPALLIVDEIGYLPVTRTGATLFFQLVNRRYEGASTVLTSNKSFEEWGEVFGDEVMAAALIDRLLHHCHIVNIRGNSFRMRQHTELWQALHGEPEPQEETTN